MQSQLPLKLAQSEPEPDVAIVPRTEAGHPDRHPTTAALVLEVSRDSLAKDRVTKGAVYAGAGIPESVIVNLVDDCLEVHRDPDVAARRYRTVLTLTSGDRFESAEVSGFAFAVDALLA
jgi:hypothetical protein